MNVYLNLTAHSATMARCFTMPVKLFGKRKTYWVFCSLPLLFCHISQKFWKIDWASFIWIQLKNITYKYSTFEEPETGGSGLYELVSVWTTCGAWCSHGGWTHVTEVSCVALPCVWGLGKWLSLYVATRLLLVKCYNNKMVKFPFNLIISPLIKPQVANQQQQKIIQNIIVVNWTQLNIPCQVCIDKAKMMFAKM